MTPNICIYSIFRDNAEGTYIEDYFDRVCALEWPVENMRLVLAEGDSVDDTYDRLRRVAVGKDPRHTILQHHTGQPQSDYKKYRFTTNPNRLQTTSQMYNLCIEEILRQDWADLAFLVESDLIYQPDILNELLSAMDDITGAISPMVWIGMKHKIFYDFWAYRKEEQNFPDASPAWFSIHFPNEPFLVDSMGSCILHRMDPVKNGARYTAEEEVVGFTKSIRQMGWDLLVHPNVHIIHPLTEHLRKAGLIE